MNVIISVVLGSLVICAIVGYFTGDRFFHSAHRWLRWFT
jgi:hypothetical protein